MVAAIACYRPTTLWLCMCTHRTAFGHWCRGHTSSWHGGCWCASEWGVLTIFAATTRSNVVFWIGRASGNYFGFSRRHLQSSRFLPLMARLSICQPEPFLVTKKPATLPAASDRFLNLLDMSLLGHRGPSWRNKQKLQGFTFRIHFRSSACVISLGVFQEATGKPAEEFPMNKDQALQGIFLNPILPTEPTLCYSRQLVMKNRQESGRSNALIRRIPLAWYQSEKGTLDM